MNFSVLEMDSAHCRMAPMLSCKPVMQGSTVHIWEKLHSRKVIFGTGLPFSLF